MTTIKDVAEKAGVSISTASYALNNHPNVSAKTRAKILEVAKELNYYPNASARNLKTRKTGNVGFLIYGFDGPIFGDILEGVNEELQRKNYNIIVSSGVSSATILKERQVDAAIVFDSNLDEETIKNYANFSPVVLLDRNLEYKNIYTSRVDNYNLVIELINGAIKKGYKNIAFFAGPKDSPSNYERYEGFKKALENNNLKEFAYYQGDFTIQKAYEIGGLIAKDDNKPDFIYCANDESAVGLLKALQENDVAVPKEIAIAGFDGILLGEYVSPSITTIQIDYKEWGHHLAQFIISKLNGKGKFKLNDPTAKIILKETT
ncbi:MAG TPA: LacI family transcriptional regulator [Acholeplasma sp.]|jgi:LacI family transcriptional regulator|nr:LacI family transcriptional regulator [Acholeplasma sp.]